jgi:hypothetical protein
MCEALRELYPDQLVAEHEPIQYNYESRRCLRNEAALAGVHSSPPVAQHFSRIHEILREKSYVEVGFPCYAMAPLLIKEFGERTKIVQLVRHPVQVAASLVTHGWFDTARRPDIELSIAPHPSDPGVLWPRFQSCWDTMSRFEKGLYYWGQVHSYGLEVEAQLAVPFCRVRLEDLLSLAEEQTRLATFLELPPASDWNKAAPRRVDGYRLTTTEQIDITSILHHPEIVSLASRFGYDVGAISESEVKRRYSTSKRTRAMQLLGRIRGQLAKRLRGLLRAPSR